MLEVWLIAGNVIGWGLYHQAKSRLNNAEYFAKAMIQDAEIREKVVREFEEFKKEQEQRS
jgi:hypothetical protein